MKTTISEYNDLIRGLIQRAISLMHSHNNNITLLQYNILENTQGGRDFMTTLYF